MKKILFILVGFLLITGCSSQTTSSENKVISTDVDNANEIIVKAVDSLLSKEHFEIVKTFETEPMNEFNEYSITTESGTYEKIGDEYTFEVIYKDLYGSKENPENNTTHHYKNENGTRYRKDYEGNFVEIDEYDHGGDVMYFFSEILSIRDVDEKNINITQEEDVITIEATVVNEQVEDKDGNVVMEENTDTINIIIKNGLLSEYSELNEASSFSSVDGTRIETPRTMKTVIKVSDIK